MYSPGPGSGHQINCRTHVPHFRCSLIHGWHYSKIYTYTFSYVQRNINKILIYHVFMCRYQLYGPTKCLEQIYRVQRFVKVRKPQERVESYQMQHQNETRTGYQADLIHRFNKSLNQLIIGDMQSLNHKTILTEAFSSAAFSRDSLKPLANTVYV